MPTTFGFCGSSLTHQTVDALAFAVSLGGREAEVDLSVTERCPYTTFVTISVEGRLGPTGLVGLAAIIDWLVPRSLDCRSAWDWRSSKAAAALRSAE